MNLPRYSALGYEDNQLLSCGIISLEKNSSHLSIPSDLCLSTGSSLSWVGFTDEGTPACYDTAGIVRIVNWYARSWMPVANTKKAKAARFIDHWWIISLSEGNKELCAILCKNSWVKNTPGFTRNTPYYNVKILRLFPEVFPRPEIEVLPMNVPLINPKTDLSVQEADLMVNRNLEGTVTGIFRIITGRWLISKFSITSTRVWCRSEYAGIGSKTNNENNFENALGRHSTRCGW